MRFVPLRNWLTRRASLLTAGLGVLSGLTGCVSPQPRPAMSVSAPVLPPISEPGTVVRSADPPPSEPAAPAPVGVEAWVQLAVSANPRLNKAAFTVESARGRYDQAGLYPNPSVAVTADELGDRTGPGGIITAPQVSQEIVTGGKLKLSQAVAAREVDQAAIGWYRERYALAAAVRGAYYDLYALERRLAVLDELDKLAADAVKTGEQLLAGELIARLDLVQLQVEAARFRSQAAAARAELPAARRRLAAAAGHPGATVGPAAGAFDEVPDYDLDGTAAAVLASHPEVLAARVGVERAQAAVRRAEVEPRPNVTLSTGYVYQGQNKSNDWLIGVSMPVPLWNRNEGNIRAARAEVAVAIQEVARVENDLAERVAVALRVYSSARALAERYRADILPKAEQAYKLSLEAFKGGQFENYLRVIQAQRGVAEARLESTRALGEAWRAAAELSGLALEESWPTVPGKMPAPAK